SGFLTEISRAVARFNGHLLLTKYGLDFTEYEAIAAEISEDPRVSAASPFAFSMVVVVRDDGSEAPAPASAPPPKTDDVDAAWGAAIDADARLQASSAPARAQAEGTPDPERPAIVVGKGIDPKRAGGFSGLAPAFGRGDLSGLRPANAGKPPGIVLGRMLRRELGVEVGERVRVVVPAELDGREESATAPPRFAVFDVTDELHTGVAELDRNLVLMHLTAAQALFFREGRVTGIEFELHDPEDAQALADELAGRLPPLYRTSTWRESNGDMLTTLEQIRVVISMILGLMGVVGAASLVASLLLVVRRKHHDIGVMLALGCDHRAVFWVFESVGLVAGTVGVVLGLGLGALYVAVIGAYRFPLGGDVYPIDHLPAQLELADAMVPVAIAMTLCAIASGPVALLAARVRILSALAR
ncbi:MAG TPA: FtsX-like permease family protein, partial [Nannocystaceae bacterium]|nr:FtsX-like permease family protein [Nannocystaceae bacterium]